MEIHYLFAGAVFGSILAFLISKSIAEARFRKLNEKTMMREHELQQIISETDKARVVAEDRLNLISGEKDEFEKKLENESTRLQETFRKLAVAEASNENLISDLSELKQRLQELMELQGKLQKQNSELEQLVARKDAENCSILQNMEVQKKETEELRKKFTLEFENIAGRILKQNTEEFSSVNQTKVNEILSPLKEKIQSFEKKVEDTYKQGLKDQTDIKAELKKLHELNNRISDEAHNLTRALKGDVKKQGNWGEVILERILERSGLSRGVEFEREVVLKNNEGKTIRPDVIVKLPDQKHIIVDSKVSLVAYERYVNSNDPAKRESHIKEHILSIKSHVKELNQKHYETAEGLNAPDFVLLFVPIESSFSVAIQKDHELFSYAWDNKVVIVSPSTLLATLRTIASIWKQENQTRNALEIARQSGILYDKFVNFIADMEKIDKGLNQARVSYDGAMNKLSVGRGNLVRATEKIRLLGAKTGKQISNKYLPEGEEEI